MTTKPSRKHSVRWNRSNWAGLAPNGIGHQKPNHYLEMAKTLWDNRDALPKKKRSFWDRILGRNKHLDAEQNAADRPVETDASGRPVETGSPSSTGETGADSGRRQP